jgi:1-acyl-sn-glycerol-3-phosphate acyltransferase
MSEQLDQAVSQTEPAIEISSDDQATPVDERSNRETQPGEEQQDLTAEIDRLVDRLRIASPEYTPPPFSGRKLVELLLQWISQLPPLLGVDLFERLRHSAISDLMDVDTWKGIWYVLNYSVQYQADFVKRRVTGDYETDEWGYDPEFVSLFKPFLEFLYTRYWRVTAGGMENVPDEGRAILVANHSGIIPFDGAMLGTAILNEHPSARMVRNLYATWFPTLPFVSTFLVKMGQVLANEENGLRLLEQEQLVATFPEGIKGVSKLYKDRYKLARFGRGGFVRMALKTKAPIIPVSVVGAEEIYINLYNAKTIARILGFPFFPISLTWPWTGVFGFIPLPTKWYLDIGKPILTDSYEPDSWNNQNLVSQLTDQVHNEVQNMVFTRLAQRRSVFLG